MYNTRMRRIVFRTEGINWAGILGIVAAIVVVLLGTWLWQNDISLTPGLVSDQGRPSLATTTPQVPPDPAPDTPAPVGGYRPFSPAHFASLPADAQVVLFFTADDCGRCTETDVALGGALAQIPADIFIYTVQFNNEVGLRRQYEVTAPHTFVQIDTLGNARQQWRGSTDLPSILARLR